MTINWDDAAIPLRNIDSTTNDVFAQSQYNEPFNSETNRMNCILDAKNSKADLKTIIESSTRIDPQEINQLYTLLKKYSFLFVGNLGIWHGKPYAIKPEPYTEPYHGKPPRIHELTFKQKQDRFEALKVIKKVNRTQWGAPTFSCTKKRQHSTFYH